jgi:hypothetical protein
VIAFDTETVAGDDLVKTVPQLVLLQAYDGRRAVVVRPDQVVRFILCHDHLEWVGHNVRFDYWVLQEELNRQSPFVPVHPGFIEEAQDSLRGLAHEGRLHDTKILDFLLQLAKQDNYSPVRPGP